MSAQRDRRVEAEACLGKRGTATLTGVSADDVGAALYAAKVATYTQGFDLLGHASEERGYGTNLAEVARVWRAGCIIRARLLESIRTALGEEDGTRLLALAPEFRSDLIGHMPAWRSVVAGATSVGLPIPGLAASLSWFDTLTTSRGSANLIQAQRDYFGSHTYERVDRPDHFVHTDWGGLGGD